MLNTLKTLSAIRCKVLLLVGTVGARRAGGTARHADAVNYSRQVIHLVAGWSFYELITYGTGKLMQHTAAGG